MAKDLSGAEVESAAKVSDAYSELRSLLECEPGCKAEKPAVFGTSISSAEKSRLLQDTAQYIEMLGTRIAELTALLADDCLEREH